MTDENDPAGDLTGDAKNFIILKRMGQLPRHVKDYGDWLAWKKQRAEGKEEPEPPPNRFFSFVEEAPVPVLAAAYSFFVAACTGALAYFSFNLIWQASAVVALAAFYAIYKLLTWAFTPGYVKRHRRAVALAASKPFPTAEQFWQTAHAALLREIRDRHDRVPNESVVATVAKGLYERTVLAIYAIPESIPENARAIILHEWWMENVDAVVENTRGVIVSVLAAYCRNIPNWATMNEGTAVGEVPVMDVTSVQVVAAIISGKFFTEDALRLELFNATRHILNLNRLKHSTKVFGKAAEGEHGRRLPLEDFTGTPAELVNAYLPDTLLEPLFEASLTYRISQKSRFEHVHIVAPSGHGKTHGALETIVARDLEAGAGMVIISPNDELLSQIAHVSSLHDFGAGSHSVTFIDPADAPALGIFDVQLHGDDQTVTQVVNEVSYFCETLIGSELTPPMSALVAPLAQLMCTIPNSNLSTFISAIDDLSPFSAEIEHLPPRLRDYLRNEMKTKSVGAPTKAAIKARLNSLLFKSPAFDRMFNATVNKVRIGEHLDGGGVLLVNCNDSFGQEQAQLLGKYFISRTLQALLQRPPGSARPAYLYIDEAWLFLDKMVTNLLRQARKYNVGLVICEPDMAHSEQGVQAGLDGVAVMLGAGYAASRLPMEKANPELVSSMRTRPPHSADFALYDRHRAKRPVRLRVPMFELRKLPQVTEADYHAYRRRNAARLRSPPAAAPTSEQSTPDGQEW